MPAPPFDRRTAVSYESWRAANDTLGNRFPGGQSHLFQGAWTDPVTGLAYHRARWYEPRSAHWLSEDPAGTVDSVNLQAFVGWGPQGGRDPLGLESGATFGAMWREETIKNQKPNSNPCMSSKSAAAFCGGTAGSLIFGATLALGTGLALSGVLSPAGFAILGVAGVLGLGADSYGNQQLREADRYEAQLPPNPVGSFALGLGDSFGPTRLFEGVTESDLGTGRSLSSEEAIHRTFAGSLASVQSGEALALGLSVRSGSPSAAGSSELQALPDGYHYRYVGDRVHVVRNPGRSVDLPAMHLDESGVLTLGPRPQAPRSTATRTAFLKQLDRAMYPSWMRPFLERGEVPPGYEVDHIKALFDRGTDTIDNMRLQAADLHDNRHRYYRPGGAIQTITPPRKQE